MAARLPFSGQSAHQRYEQVPGERRLNMIKKLAAACTTYQASELTLGAHQDPFRKRARSATCRVPSLSMVTLASMLPHRICMDTEK